VAKSIELPDELYAQLAAMARPFVDTQPADVIRRLLEERNLPDSEKPGPALVRAKAVSSKPLDARSPRQRGIRVDVDGREISAETVQDFYGQVLRHLSTTDKWKALQKHIPYRTSRKRFLVSNEPKHPEGNPFVVPVECRGVFIEAHKDYENAFRQLRSFLVKAGIGLRYLGV
jgi:hypothetical protein